MPPDQTPAPNPARREQLVALLILAAGLRRRGAGPDDLRAALQNHLALLPRPALGQAEIETITSSLAVLPPRLAIRTLDALLSPYTSPGPDLPRPPGEGRGEGGLMGEPPFPVHTAATIASDTPASVDWIAEPWAAAGALTAFTGRPKVGKTTFVLDLVAAVLAGSPFLERATRRVPVVYLTEQQPSSFRASLARSALLGNDALAVLFWHQAMALDWPRIVAAAAVQCRARGARLLVVDTLSQWAGLRGDMENQAGDAFAALQPLQQLAGTGIAVVFVQHERKGGGDAADAGRGSSAFAGAVDTLVSFRRPPYVTPSPSRLLSPPRGEAGREVKGPGDRSPAQRRRLLLALSRFESAPPELYIERGDDRYTVVGETADFAVRRARDAILAALVPLSESEEGGRDGPVATRALDDLIQVSGVPRSVAQRAIDDLMETNQICRIGAGKKGSPYRYWAQNSFLPPIE